MTLHRLWTQTTPSLNAYSDGQSGITIANAFYVHGVGDGWTCRGIRVYWPAYVQPQPLHVWAWANDADGDGGPRTVVASAAVQGVSNQWNEALWSSPIPMVNDVPIWLGYSPQNDDQYLAWTSAPPSSVRADDGAPLYLAGASEFGGRGRYEYARDTVPIQPITFSAGIDIIADDGTTPPPTSAFTAYPGMSMWDGLVEHQVSATYWDGTAERPLDGARPALYQP